MKSLSRAGQLAVRRAVRTPLRTQVLANGVIARAPVVTAHAYNGSVRSARTFHSSIAFRGIMPESENPPPKQSEDYEHPTVPTDIPTSEFHEHADRYLDELLLKLEERQETTPDIDVEYSAGVLQVKIQSKDHTYVLNKQPPNKQIWLSSPVSGPKRFDWVVTGEGMHQKEGGGVGDWIYLRDGTSLTDIIREELGIELGGDDGIPS